MHGVSLLNDLSRLISYFLPTMSTAPDDLHDEPWQLIVSTELMETGHTQRDEDTTGTMDASTNRSLASLDEYLPATVMVHSSASSRVSPPMPEAWTVRSDIPTHSVDVSHDCQDCIGRGDRFKRFIDMPSNTTAPLHKDVLKLRPSTAKERSQNEHNSVHGTGEEHSRCCLNGSANHSKPKFRRCKCLPVQSSDLSPSKPHKVTNKHGKAKSRDDSASLSGRSALTSPSMGEGVRDADSISDRSTQDTDASRSELRKVIHEHTRQEISLLTSDRLMVHTYGLCKTLPGVARDTLGINAQLLRETADAKDKVTNELSKLERPDLSPSLSLWSAPVTSLSAALEDENTSLHDSESDHAGKEMVLDPSMRFKGTYCTVQ